MVRTILMFALAVLSLVVFNAVPTTVSAETLAKTQDGRTVVLHVDGTWTYADADTNRREYEDGMSARAFRAMKPAHSVLMRVYCELDDYFNYEFSDYQDTAWSIRMYSPNDENFGHAYAKRNSQLGVDIYNKLKDGTRHKAVVKVACLPNAEDGSVFLLKSIVAFDTWERPAPE